MRLRKPLLGLVGTLGLGSGLHAQAPVVPLLPPAAVPPKGPPPVTPTAPPTQPPVEPPPPAPPALAEVSARDFPPAPAGPAPVVAPHLIGFHPVADAAFKEMFPVTVLVKTPAPRPMPLPLPPGAALQPAAAGQPASAVAFNGRQMVVVTRSSGRAGGYAIVENESPQPRDRVFGGFNYYYGGTARPRPDVPGVTGFAAGPASLAGFGPPVATGTAPGGLAFLAALQQSNPAAYDNYVRTLVATGGNAPGIPGTTTTTTTPVTVTVPGNRPNDPNGSPAPPTTVTRLVTATTTTPGFAGFNAGPGAVTVSGSPYVSANGLDLTRPRTHFYRETFGFEKSFLGGDASFGMRVPTFQIQGDGSFTQSDFGDITAVGKYALVNDLDAGRVLTGGLAVTAPTGPAVRLASGDLNSTLLQPFVGYIRAYDRFYYQGFSSLVVPTDGRDVTTFFNSFAVGYAAYRNPNGLLTSFTPTLEVHVSTPLNHRDPLTAEVYVPDLVAFTAGAHLGLGGRSLLTVGTSVPVTGPRPYQVEAIAFLNMFF